MGDTQIHQEGVGNMLQGIESRHPETAFYMVGGDLVDMGELRNHWDAFLVNTMDAFSRKPIVPTLGNHDSEGLKGRGRLIYSRYFTLPGNGPAGMTPGAAYSFFHNNVFFIVLDSQNDINAQASWLEGELRNAASAKARFKVVMFHVPVYNPKKHRSNPEVQRHWVPLFDKYDVDLVLNGHDHSYMRSVNLRAGKPPAVGEHGTTYVVATGCDKHYAFEKLDIAAVQFNSVPTYQRIVVGKNDAGLDSLTYTACDTNGRVLDAFELVNDKGE